MEDDSSCSSIFQLAHSEYQEFEDIGCPPGWRLCIHPQGWIYFHNPTLRVVTDQDIRQDSGLYQSITLAAKGFPDLERHMELQVHVSATGTQDLSLTINHRHCIASYNPEEALLLDEEHALMTIALLVNRRRRLYWNYLWTHPSHVPLPERAIADAADALTWFYTDNLISGSKSTAPFSKSECEELTQVLHSLSAPCYANSAGKTVFVAWLLREVCSFRDSEHYGQHTLKAAQAMRKERNVPRAKQRSPNTIAFMNFVINLLFFGIPHTYYTHVKVSSEYRGRLSNVQQNWEKYIDRLVREYSHFLLVATVLLSATVGVLSVNDVSDLVIASASVSSFCSLGSIVVGVFFIWRHQTNTGTRESFTYLHNAQHQFLGLHGHAMLLSLPPVLLVWAIVTFTLSIVSYTIERKKDPSAWVTLGAFVVFFFIVASAVYIFSVIWKFRARSWSIGRWTPWIRAKPRDHLVPLSER